MTKEVTVTMPNIRVEIPQVKIPAGMPDITQSQKYQDGLSELRKVAEDAHQRANEADTMIERIKILCEQIGEKVSAETAELRMSHN